MVADIYLDPKAANELAELAKRLKKLGDGKTIPKEFRAALRSGVQPAARDAKNEARSLPSGRGIRRKKDERPSLRRQMANAISVQVKLGGDARVAIRVSKRSLGNRRDLPFLTNRGFWTHPVFGEAPEVPQESKKDWFDDVMRKSKPDVQAVLEKKIKEFERRVMKGV